MCSYVVLSKSKIIVCFVFNFIILHLQVVAKQLVTLANKTGHRNQGMSPFAAAAHKAGYDSYFGGKLDDTTAVVSYVT